MGTQWKHETAKEPDRVPAIFQNAQPESRSFYCHGWKGLIDGEEVAAIVHHRQDVIWVCAILHVRLKIALLCKPTPGNLFDPREYPVSAQGPPG